MYSITMGQRISVYFPPNTCRYAILCILDSWRRHYLVRTNPYLTDSLSSGTASSSETPWLDLGVG